MGYSISHDWSNYDENMINHGENVLRSSCKHKDGVEEKDWCDKCNISEDSAQPMINFLYPLELSDFEDSKILKVVKETNCTVIENSETGEWFLTLCGGGMDLSQDIAFAFQILETWLPSDLIRNVCKQPGLSLGIKNYKSLAKGMIKQFKIEEAQNKEKAKEWKESLKNLRDKEKAKKLEKLQEIQ